MKTKIWIALMIVALVSGTVAWREFDQERRTQEMLNEAAAKRRRVDAEVDVTGKRIATANRSLDVLRATGSATSAAAQKPPTPAKEAGAAPALHDVLVAHPELRDWFRRDYRFKLRDDYGRFYRAAHLTAEQIKKFEQLMLDAEEEKMDLEIALRARDPGKSVAKNLRDQSDAKLRAAQMELLGETGYAQLVETNRPQIKFLDRIQDHLAQTASPLTGEQRDQLSRLLATTVRSTSVKNAGPQTTMMNIDWPRVWQSAPAILSPAQFTVLKTESSWTEFQFLVRDFATREIVMRQK